MKPLIIHIIILFAFLHAVSQDANVVFKEAQRLEIALNESAAFLKYSEVVKLQPTNIKAVVKCSELCSRIGKRQKNDKLRDHYYAAAKKFADLALQLDPNNSDANAVMAMWLGHLTMSKSNKEKIALVKDIRKYVDASLKADPNNYKAWHILGRWHYEISNLNAMERAAAKVFFGGIPQGSLKESIAAFEKANTLTGGFALNSLELAKAYKRNDEDAKAIATLQKMLTFPNHTEDDAQLKETAKKLLKDWQ